MKKAPKMHFKLMLAGYMLQNLWLCNISELV